MQAFVKAPESAHPGGWGGARQDTGRKSIGGTNAEGSRADGLENPKLRAGASLDPHHEERRKPVPYVLLLSLSYL